MRAFTGLKTVRLLAGEAAAVSMPFGFMQRRLTGMQEARVKQNSTAGTQTCSFGQYYSLSAEEN